MKRRFMLSLALSTWLVGVSCGGSGSGGGSPTTPTTPTTPTSPGPSITSIAPTQARLLTDVWLTGREFLTTNLGAPVVKFSFGRFVATATVREATNTKLTVTAPSGITESATVTVERAGVAPSNGVTFIPLPDNAFDGDYRSGQISVPLGTVAIDLSLADRPIPWEVNVTYVDPATGSLKSCFQERGTWDIVNNETSYGCFAYVWNGSAVLISGCFTSLTHIEGSFQMNSFYDQSFPICKGPITWSADRK